MKEEALNIEKIPAILWGEESDRVYISVHGKLSSKEESRGFAEKAAQKGFQVLSFDLPEHGDRKNEGYPCTVWNAVSDLLIIGQYVLRRKWSYICLYGSSLGAYFSLLAYKDYPIQKCLFLSPILNMERLIKNIMNRFGVSEETLKEKREIPIPTDETLNWDYLCYVRENPIVKWNAPTSILYGSEDNLTELGVVEGFTKQYNCRLTVVDGGEHWFHTKDQLAVLDKWLNSEI